MYPILSALLPSPGILAVPIVFSLFLLSCQREVTLTSTDAVGLVPSYQSFYWEFDQDLAPQDSVGKWTETPFVHFDPPLPGKFSWKNKRRLTFKSSELLDPAQQYNWSLGKALGFKSNLKIGEEKNSFHTAPFQLVDLRVAWHDPSDGYTPFKAPVRLVLEFNYEVNGYKLGEYLEVTRNGQPVGKIQPQTSWDELQHAFHWEGEAESEEAQCFEVKIRKGLLPGFDRSALSSDILAELTLPPMSELKITDVQQRTEYNNARIDVMTSQPVDIRFVKSFLELNPTVNHELEDISGGFRIKGDFKPGSEISVRLKNGCPGMMGGRLEENWEYKLVMPRLEPFLRFTDRQGAYLMRNGLENVAVSSVGVPKFTVSLYEIYENNLIHFLDKNSGQFRNRWWYENTYDYFYDGGGYVTLDNYGREISTDTIEVNAPPRKGSYQQTNIDFKGQKASPYRGIYAVEIKDLEDYWRQDRKVISLSDLGLIAKRTGDEILVFVNRLSTAQPVAGAQVKLISTTNQTLLTATTDGAGVARFSKLETRTAGFEPRLITVIRGEDFNFLDLSRTKQRTGGFDLDGKSPLIGNLDLFLYGDRNLYRPGDTAHLAGIFRKWDLNPLAQVPLKLEVEGPRGLEVINAKLVTNRQGGFNLDIPLPGSNATGLYSATVYDGIGHYLKSYNFQVEEFVPDKIKVALEAPDSTYRKGETARIDLAAKYYFGTPCADHKYEVDYSLRHKYFDSKRFPNHSFYTLQTSWPNIPGSKITGKLDSLGKTTLEYPIPQHLNNVDGIMVDANVTVFDNTGHTVLRNETIKAHLKDRYLGVDWPRDMEKQYATIPFSFVGVDHLDQPLKDHKVVVEVVRHDYNRVLQQGLGGIRYKSEKKTVVLKQDTLRLGNEPTVVKVRVDEAGEHKVTVKDLYGTSITEREFTVFGPKVEESNSFAVDPEGKIRIKADQERYKTGNTARLVFTTPFSGRMLVTVERDKVYRYYYLEVNGNTATLNLPLDFNHVPNVFISATLFRPQRNQRGLVLTKAQGYTQIQVDQPSRKIPLQIQAAKMARPGSQEMVTVRGPAGQDLMLTLAAVDEGILSIKGFEAPDPYDHFYEARELLVKSYDLYRFLLPEHPSAEGATGGGYFALADIGGNNFNPITAKRFKPMAFWSGLVEMGPDGVARIPVDIPAEFNGKVRLMAVAYAGKNFGSAQASMIARDDVVMVPGLPRFLTSGDSMYIPLNLLNATADSVRVEASIEVEGPVELSGADKQSLKIAPGASEVVGFPIQTKKQIGVAQFHFRLRGDENREQHFEMAIRPPGAYESRTGYGVLEGTDSSSIQIPTGFYPDMQQSQVYLSNGLGLAFLDHVDYLLRYPHGCSEQITSKLFPQLFFPELTTLVQSQGEADNETESQAKQDRSIENIREGIRQLEARISYDGAVALWPNGSSENWWTTAYVAHFLTAAKQKGFPVKDFLLERLFDYLREQSGQSSTQMTSWIDENGPQTGLRVRKEIPYSLFVLALAGEPDLSIMNLYKSQPEKLTWDSQVLLAASYALIGKQAEFLELMPEDFVYQEPVRRLGGTFDSQIRSLGMVLYVLAEVDPDHPLVNPGLKRLRSSSSIISTQDRVWALLALGRLTERQVQAAQQVQVYLDGQIQGTYSGKDLEWKSRDWMGKTLALKSQGSGEAHYAWQIRGISSDSAAYVETMQNGLQIERRILTTDGDEIIHPVFRQGEILAVQVRLTAAQECENIALVDLIPAGFEIENTRLRPEAFAWAPEGSSSSQYMDIRDDRIVYYFDLAKGESKTFTYLVRTVSQGEFLYPPASAEAMYNPAIMAKIGGSTVEIREPEAPLPFRLSPTLHPDCKDPGEERFRALWEQLQGDSPSLRMMRRRLLNAPIVQ